MNPALRQTLQAIATQPNPLERLRAVVQQHQQQAPLSEADLAHLALELSVPSVHPRLLLYHLRAACGLEPVPGSAQVVGWLRGNADAIGRVLEPDLRSCPLTYSDWSVTAPQFIPPQQYDDPEGFTERIWQGIHSAGAVAAIGGYNHIRPAYGGQLFASGGGARTLHLGLDVFLEPGNPVFAPLGGTVHSVADNVARFDYGPCVVLEHQLPPEGQVFYTLYGHLTRAVLELRPGQPISQGQQIAQIGNYPENGNWPPHLHLQIILDMLDKQGDFWGSCHPQQAKVWFSLCPDANLIAQVPAELFPTVPPEKRCGVAGVVARGPDGTGYDACGQRVD